MSVLRRVSGSFLCWLLLDACLSLCPAVHAQSIFTVAGGGTDDGRPATTVALDEIAGIAVDAFGNLYIAETPKHRVRRVVLASGVITTVAGRGAKGFSGDGGAATLASLDEPTDVATDREGNLYIADANNHRVRRVEIATGIIRTVAGTTSFGFTGDGGPATAARLFRPEFVAVDSDGNLYINVSVNRRIRRVDAATGMIRTFAGNGGEGFSGDGGPATDAQFSRARGIAVDASGNLFIADYGNSRIRRVDRATGIISTVAGNGTFGTSGDGGPAILATLHGPQDVWVDGAGNLLIVDVNGGRIRKVDAVSRIITTIAGGSKYCDPDDGVQATECSLWPRAVSASADGSILISGHQSGASTLPNNSRVRRVDPASGIISTVAGTIHTSIVFNGDGGPAALAILDIGGPFSSFRLGGVALDAGGNLFIADTNASRIRKVDGVTGRISTVAGGTSSGFTGLGALPTGIAVDAAGNIFVADEGYRYIRRIDAATGAISQYAGGGSSRGDGGPATRASVGSVSGLATDAPGNLFLSDGQSIRRIDAATRVITTIAGGTGNGGFGGDGGPASQALLASPKGLDVDASGNLFVADFANHRIRRIDAATGTITTVAGSGSGFFSGDGGPATAAKLNWPVAVAVDAAGNLFIADQFHYRIRRVDGGTGRISTYAGIGSVELKGGYFGDDGPASQAGLALPAGVAVSPAGDLFIVDAQANRVRVVYACREIGEPRLSAPTNGSSGVATSPRFAWSQVKGAFRYDVYLGNDSSRQTLVVGDLTATSFSPANLDPLTTYYWHVIAKGDPYCTPVLTAASEVRSFTTASGCRAPAGFEGASP